MRCKLVPLLEVHIFEQEPKAEDDHIERPGRHDDTRVDDEDQDYSDAKQRFVGQDVVGCRRVVSRNFRDERNRALAEHRDDGDHEVRAPRDSCIDEW